MFINAGLGSSASSKKAASVISVSGLSSISLKAFAYPGCIRSKNDFNLKSELFRLFLLTNELVWRCELTWYNGIEGQETWR